MIDVTDLSSIPLEIKQAVVEYAHNLPDEVITAIKSMSVQNNSDVLFAIEGYFAPYKADKLYEKVLGCLEKCNIQCFHATRIMDENEIRDHGLQTNSPERYLTRLSDSMQKIGIQHNDIEEAIRLVNHEYDRKYSERKAQLCFFTPYTLISDNEYAAYDQFCQNIGGELARWSLKEKMPQVYQKLTKSGFAAVIEFLLPFSDIVSYNKDRVAYQFVAHYASEIFWGRKYPICFDATTEGDVPPEQIIEIHHYCGEIDYE